MHKSLQPLDQIATLNFDMVLKTAELLTEEQSLKKITGKINCANWILGHLVTGRHYLIGMSGIKPEVDPLSEIYDRGAILTPETEYKKLSEIKEAWIQISGNINNVFFQITEETLEKESPINFPIGDKTILGGLTFLLSHESYHIGQLALIRKELGLETFFD